MSLDETRKTDWEQMQRDRGIALDNAAALKGGGGGGTYDGMENRVSKLEANVDGIKDKLSDIRVLLASIDERTKHMPTRWDVVLILAAMAGLIGGVVAIAARFLP